MRKFLTSVVVFGIIAMVIVFGNTGMNFSADKAESSIYRSHHRPNPGWYYSVDESSTEGNKTFIIGTNVRPQVGGTVIENGKLVEIEVPSKKVGALKGAYCIVRNVDRVPTTVYFVDEKAVVLDALQN